MPIEAGGGAVTFSALMLLFPVVLAIHNLDEALGRADFASAWHRKLDPRLADRRVRAAAASLLTLAAATIAIANYLDSTAASQLAARIAVFALFLNAIGHCAISILKGRLLPGTVTAACLVIPFSVVALYSARADVARSAQAFLGHVALGAITLPAAAYLSLWGGFAVNRIRDASRR